MLSYEEDDDDNNDEEEDEDSDIFGESDGDEDKDDSTKVKYFLNFATEEICVLDALFVISLKSFTYDLQFIYMFYFVCHIQNTGPSSFADELAARIKGEPVKKTEGDRACKSVIMNQLAVYHLLFITPTSHN